MHTVRIFISSSQDCASERAAAKAVIAKLNQDPVIRQLANVLAIAWDGKIPVPFDAIHSPQISVDRHLPAPESCDVFVGIARCRFGTPIARAELRKEDGQPYLSGTEYEFTRAWHARRRGAALPYILFYRHQGAILGRCPKGPQAALSAAFFSAPPFNGEEGMNGGVTPFSNTAQFTEKLESDLRTLIGNWHIYAGMPFEDWLQRQAHKVTTAAGPRYTKAAHVCSGIEKEFDWLLWRQAAVAALDKKLSRVWEELAEQTQFGDMRAALAAAGEELRAAPHVMPDLGALQSLMEEMKQRARELIAKRRKQSDHFDDELSSLYALADAASGVLDQLSMRGAYAQKRAMLLFGPAGQGKTHTLVHELNKVLAAGGVAVGVLCHTLTESGSLEQGMLDKLGYRDTWPRLLDELSSAGAKRGERVLIVIDALNETRNYHRWRDELDGLLDEILRRPNLAVVLSIREDYRRLVLPPDQRQEPRWELSLHTGFAGIEPDALLAYCQHYGVTLPVTPPMAELENPLYLQMLMKSLVDKPALQDRLPSWLEVWSAWMDRLEYEAIRELKLSPRRQQPVHRTLRQLAALMLADPQFRLSREDAELEAKKHAGMPELIDFLCSAGALMLRLEADDSEIVEFGFERLSDTFFVDQLLRDLFKDCPQPQQRRARLAAALAADGSLSPLATLSHDSDSMLARRRPGLLAALCLAAPVMAQVELAELIAPELISDHGATEIDTALRRAITDSFRWRSKPEEFALESPALVRMWDTRGNLSTQQEQIDELIKLALTPEHPLAFDKVLHPALLASPSPGARDAHWSIVLVELWSEDSSNVQIFMRWAREARLDGLAPSVALPAARLLAWFTSVPQKAMRKAAIEGLTRVLTACPACLPDWLPEMLSVNDAYVVEAVLVATWGAVRGATAHPALAEAVDLVHQAMFKDGNASWVHLTIRHYARSIVEFGIEQGWLQLSNPASLRPPYRSSLPLDQVPDKEALYASDRSKGYGAIVHSACDRDFFWYVMGGTSGPKPFSPLPLPHSTEPARPYPKRAAQKGPLSTQDVFDIPLAARFVAWHCVALGWTAARFDFFDQRIDAAGSARIGDDGRTERMGKKYQWIAWQTMLAFLADNYQMRPGDGHKFYENPHNISYIDKMDPSHWLARASTSQLARDDAAFWHMPSLPRWPLPEMDDIYRWGASTTNELPPADVICSVPPLPPAWGQGRWLRIAADFIWQQDFVPGVWARDEEYLADTWWQVVPGLIPSLQLPQLLEAVQHGAARQEIAGTSRYNYFRDSETPLASWPLLDTDPDDTEFGYGFPQLPVDWMPLAGRSVAPDGDGETGPLLPLPHLLREWDLALDLHQGVVRRNDQPLFGLAGWSGAGEALFAHAEALLSLLHEHGMTLVWLLVGERRATLDYGNLNGWDRMSWIDMRGIAFLGVDGCVNTACMVRTPQHPG